MTDHSNTDTGVVLLTEAEVAAALHVSKRHVRRLSDSGRMPRPVKLGRLVRWQRTEIDAWIAAGCPAVSRMAERN